jgi:hypothetical protein
MYLDTGTNYYYYIQASKINVDAEDRSIPFTKVLRTVRIGRRDSIF